MSFKIDEVDRKILSRLQENARTTFREISEGIDVSESTVFVRVKKLLERGVIKRFTAVVSQEAVGKSLTAFVLIKADPKKYPLVLETLAKIKDIYELYDVTGNYYSIAKVHAEDREKLSEILDAIGVIEGITSTETAIALRTLKEETRINFCV